MALLAIRERRLYRAKYATFDYYCRQRWSFTDDYARLLMRGSEVVSNLLPIGNMPTNEAQVRPLTQLETPEAQQAAWQQAVETAPGGKITAAHVQSVVNEMRLLARAEVVYFIEGGGLIKIGYSATLTARLAELCYLSPVPLTLLCTMPGNRSVEQQLHQRFAHLRDHGEWFRSDEALLEVIESLMDGGYEQAI